MQFVLQIYQLSRDGYSTQLIVSRTLSRTDNACQINLPTDETNANIKIKSSTLKLNKQRMIAVWGQTDGNLFVSIF